MRRHLGGRTVGVLLGLCTISACGQMMGARALPPLPPGVTVDASEEHYDVTGRTVEEITRSLRASASSALGGRIRGMHRWDIQWRYQYIQGPAGCNVTQVTIEMTSDITLPRWLDREATGPDVALMWDDYITALRAHEFTHRESAYRAARDISREVGRLETPLCGGMRSLARTTAARIFDRYEDQNREFDEESRGRITWPLRPSG